MRNWVERKSSHATCSAFETERHKKFKNTRPCKKEQPRMRTSGLRMSSVAVVPNARCSESGW